MEAEGTLPYIAEGNSLGNHICNCENDIWLLNLRRDSCRMKRLHRTDILAHAVLPIKFKRLKPHDCSAVERTTFDLGTFATEMLFCLDAAAQHETCEAKP
jgi:hypothetical protein